ncbi:MAG: hypothetical protein ABI352_01935 [Candidatus Dormibacter sp.]
MPQVIYTDQNEEIVELVDRVRKAPDNEVALVLGAGSVGLQSPLNVRLLRQLGTRAGKTVSIISGDPYIQELSRVGGLATYASVPAFERGIQTVRSHADDGAGYGAAGTVGAATALATAPPLAPPLPPRTAAAPPGGATPATGGKGLGGRRRPLYFAAAGLVILGLVLILFVAPSAKVTITLAGTPLTASPTIQGSTDPQNAGQADHIVTSVVTSTQSSQFTATPTGKQAVPAKAATAQVVLQTDLPTVAPFTVPKGEEFDTADNPPIKFYATQDTVVTMPPPSAGQQYGAASNPIPVADGTPEAKGNVAANTITKWPSNPCNPPAVICNPTDIKATNPAAATGGADAKTNVVASTQDVAAWTAQVTQSETGLFAQAKVDLQTRAAGKTLAVDPGGNGTTVACAVTPTLPAANAVVATAQETVTCNGKGAVYNAGDVTTDVTADLQKQVAQGDSLAADSINCTKPAVTQAADDGTVVLSVQCTSFSRPNIDLNALKGQLSGKSPSDARNLIEHRLNRVQNVAISQSPVPFFWLPFISSRIEIDETFVAQPSPTGT